MREQKKTLESWCFSFQSRLPVIENDLIVFLYWLAREIEFYYWQTLLMFLATLVFFSPFKSEAFYLAQKIYRFRILKRENWINFMRLSFLYWIFWGPISKKKFLNFLQKVESWMILTMCTKKFYAKKKVESRLEINWPYCHLGLLWRKR